MKGLGNIMKQAQEMQGRMAQFQEELAGVSVTGSAGGGMVDVTLNGKQVLEKVRIDPAMVNPDDVEMLEDLIAAAFNDAQQKLQDVTKSRLKEVTGGLNIPGMNLPF